LDRAYSNDLTLVRIPDIVDTTIEIAVADKLTFLASRSLLVGVDAVLLFKVVVGVVEVGPEIANIRLNGSLGNSHSLSEGLV
jgi:hypothetical protein